MTKIRSPLAHPLRFKLIQQIGLTLCLCHLMASASHAQRKAKPIPDLPRPTAQALAKERGLIDEVLEPEITLELQEDHSKLLRTKWTVSRTSVIDPQVVEVTQFGSNELEIIGVKEGATDLTLWFTDPLHPDDTKILRYRVRVTAPTEIDNRRRREYGELEDKLNELFPNSSIELVIVADKLLVRGQARDSEEATDIIAMVRKQANANAMSGVNTVNVAQGPAADPLPGTTPLPPSTVISMLKVPGEQQVMLKVRVAELSRTALRELGLDWSVSKSNFSLASNLGNTGNIVALLDGRDVSLMLSALSTNSYSKVLAEPNLVTLSGRPASFIAGGQFAVPTAVGVSGVQAATTFFQGFGTQVRFIPTVIDKDRIRLRVAPTFSTLNNDNKVNGIPGLNTRSVFTTVDMREGQWLAIAGLIQDQQEGSRARVPYLGDLPIIGPTLFGKNSIQRDETELLILVSPQLVHPLEPEVAPQILPGMEVTEPNNTDFFWGGMIEGRPNCDHRSTVWAAERTAVRRAIHQSKQEARYRQTQQYFVPTPHGFSE